MACVEVDRSNTWVGEPLAISCDCEGKLVDKTATWTLDSRDDEPIFDGLIEEDLVRVIFGATVSEVINLSGFTGS